MERNTCENSLANIGLAFSYLVWFPSIPQSFNTEYIRNKLGMPNYRFVSF